MGRKGRQGDRGDPGLPGAKGLPGERGDKGERGETGIMGPRENVDRLIKRIEKLEHEILFEHPSEEHPNGTSVMFKPSLEPQHTDMSTEVEKVAQSSSTVKSRIEAKNI